jgi:hypothetical protein
MTKILCKTKIHHFFAISSRFATRLLCWQDCQIALVDESGVFPVDIPPWFCVLIYHLGIKNRLVGGCSSHM